MRKQTFNFGKNNAQAIITDKNGCFLSLEKYFGDCGSKFVPIDQQKEKELIIQIQAGDKKAEKKLFLIHSRFVISIAKKMHDQCKNEARSVSLNDFIQWGNLGLVEAMRRFDHSFGVRLTSFAVYLIAQRIQAGYAKTGNLIRLPSNQHALIKAYREEKTKLSDPLLELYEGNEDVILTDIYSLLSDRAKAALLIPKQIHGLDDLLTARTSADDEMRDVEFKTHEALFSDVTSDKQLLCESLQIEIARSLGTLDDIERMVLILLFGIRPFYQKIFNSIIAKHPDRTARYYEQYELEMDSKGVAEIVDLGSGRIHQIKQKALQRLRHTSRSKLLKEYLG